MIFGIILMILLICWIFSIIYRNYNPFINFSKKSKHCNGVALKFLNAGPKDCYDKVLSPLVHAGYDSFWLGYDFAVVLRDPNDIKIALNSDKCFEKYSNYRFFANYGLLIEGGEKYKQQRKSLSPLFLPSNLKTFIPIINKTFNYFMNENINQIEDKAFLMKEYASKFALNTVLWTILRLKSQVISDDELVDLIAILDEYVTSCRERFFKFWIHPDFLFKLSSEYRLKMKHLKMVVEMCQRIIIDNKIELDFDEITYLGCMKNHLIQMGTEELLESSLLFLGASFETTAVSLSSIFFMLASNSDKQEKLYCEISSILSSYKDEVTEDMMNQMKYLDLIIKETLRLLPVAVFHARLATDDIEFTNFTAPKGSFLVLPTLEIHRDKKIWGEDALEFKPERFESENFRKIHPYAYFPFSGGARMCPGYKYAMITMKIFISRFIMKYRVTTNMKYEDLKFIFSFTTDYKQRPLLRLSKR